MDFCSMLCVPCSMINIDAKDKILGRLATEVSTLIIGKNKPDFVPYKITGQKVEVVNVDKIAVSGKKMDDKIYYTHTGYTGHLKKIPMKSISKQELLKKAVWNMLPKNKLRKERMKLLTIIL